MSDGTQNAEVGNTSSTTSAASSGPDRPKLLHPLLASEVIFGLVCIGLWLALFTAGTFVATEEFRSAIGKPGATPFGKQVLAWFVVLTCYTFSNAALLSCLASVIGKFSRRSLAYEVASIQQLPSAPEPRLREVLVMYSVAIARGWVIFLMLGAGLLILTTDAIANPKQGDYIRLAGTISVIGFLAGYDADLFKRLLDRVAMLSIDSPKKG